MTNSQKEKTHFGFRDVDWSEKTGLVHDVFSSVASRYDIMNDLMSMGLHRLWKREFVSELSPLPGRSYIDVAGGTGDIACLIADKVAKAPSTRIVIADINNSMLEAGRDNIINKNVRFPFEFLCANAEKLPLDDNQFDGYTIAFGIRNVTDIPAALKEAHRVLKPGGRFFCLEFSKVENELFEKIYDLYSFKIIPKVGELVTNDRESYQYLVESIRKFPGAETFRNMIQDAGFKDCTFKRLTGGIVAIHSGVKTAK